MFNTTFNPGPSQISEETKNDIREALDQKILEISHRSPQFSEISTQAIEGLRELLSIPKDYHVFYLDSASQAWHSILCNTVAKNSFHFINGAFSEKFYKAAQALGKNPQHQTVEWGSQNDFSTDISPETELITACYNETSTGVMMTASQLSNLREKNPQSLISIDITSCAGAVDLDMTQADLWYFSVQKCFGLPAGLGIVIVSPDAYEKSQALSAKGENLAGIWAWEKLNKPMIEKNHQTPQTPNVLNIYLLAKQCERWNKKGGLKAIMAETKEKKNLIEAWVKSQGELEWFPSDSSTISDSVFAIKAEPKTIIGIHEICAQNKIVLGKGYGKTKSEVFRIANFPAISVAEIKNLITLLSQRIPQKES